MEFKEYVVTLYKHEDLDSFYEDMETPGGNLYIPDRAVEVANRRPISRNTHYWLTDEEAILLKSDPRVWDVSLTPEELGLVPVSGWIDTNGYYSKDTVTTVNDRNWGLLRGFDNDHVSGWGSDGATKARTSTLDSKLNGTNVDIVVFGYTIASSAPEFAVNADGTGGSRYFYVNWGDYGLGSLYTQSPLVYSRDGEHETICASIALGNTQGWARKARFTSIPFYTTYYDYVRAWHQAKSINPDTGFKTPTIVTDSYGFNYGIDATAITSITYRGTTYNGPFDTSTDFSQYKLWLNTTGDTVYNQANGRVVFSNRTTAQLADIEDLVAAGVIFVGIAHNWRAYHAVENDQDWNNSITWSGGTYYYNRGTYASATGAIQAGAIMDLASNTPSPRSGRGPRVNIWAPSRTTGYSFYAGETPDGTGLGFNGGSQTDPASQGYLPMVKNSRDPRNSNYYIVKTTDGTSFSAPQIAGVIGLWAELKPNLTPAEALALLQTYGDVTGVVSTSANYGDWTSTAGATALALGFSPPTFNISASTTLLNSGQTITYTVTTTNVPDGSTLYLKEAGTAIASDFTDNSTQFTVTINSNSATITRTISASASASKTSILELKTGGYNGTVQTSSTVYINTALGSLTNFLNSYQSDFSYINLLSAADLTAAGSAYAMPAEISTTQISVASFGATGNGSDQTSQIQAALNAGSGKTVYFPPGTYVVSSTLTIPANTRLLGDNVLQNTVIKASSSLPAGSPLFTSSGNITYIQKIVIDGNNNPNRTEGLLFFYNVRYVYLIQSIIQNTSHMGMAAGGCLDVRVWGCKFENCGRPTYSSSIGSTPAFWSDTLNGVVARDVYLEKNLFLNNNWSAAYLMPTGGYFRDNLLVNNKESGIYSNQNANFVVYENNYIYGQRRQNISASGIEIDGGYNLTIRNNIIHNCGNDGISLQNSNGSTIENNTCYDNGAEYTYAAFGTASGIMLYSTNSAGTYNCIIRYNRCYNTTGTQRYGIYLYRSGGPTINTCTITNNNNYTNAVAQISNNASAVGGTTTIASNISNSAITTEGASGVSATVQNIFNTSLKTFSITASPTTGEPNTVITYTINTTSIPNGIKLYLQEIGSASATDFQWIDNVVAINNNSATITRTIGNITSAKTSTLSLREGSISGTSRATVSVGLTATSKTYNVWPLTAAISEGRALTFKIATTGVPNGTVLYYTISGGVTASDFTDNTLVGQFTVTDGIGQFTKNLSVDAVSDNNESIVCTIFSDPNRLFAVTTTSGHYLISSKDQNATYSLSAITSRSSLAVTPAGQIDERYRQDVVFTLQTTNIPPGTLVPYQITGVTLDDLRNTESLTGNFVIADPTPGLSNYNDLGGWVFYPKREIDGDVTDVFIRGNRVIVSEEIWWSGTLVGGVWTPTGPSGITSSGNSLKRVSDKYKAAGYSTGLSITPYALTHRYRAETGTIEYNVAAIDFESLMTEISQSGVDFVQLNPHLFSPDDPLSKLNGSLYWNEASLLAITNQFKTRVTALGKQFNVVVQGWRQTAQSAATVNNYNTSLYALTGVDEFYVFGQEDALDLTSTVSLSNDLSQTISTELSFRIGSDSLVEGPETMTMTITGPGVDKNNTLYPQVSGTLSASVTINDTAKEIFVLTATNSSGNPFTSSNPLTEGNQVRFNLTVTGVNPGTSVPFVLEGVNSEDLSGSPPLGGAFVIPPYTKPIKSNFGAVNGWFGYTGAELDSTIKGSTEALYRKALFWTPGYKSGIDLQNQVQLIKDAGYECALYVIPYILFSGGADGTGPTKTATELSTEIDQSGADSIVILTSYLPVDYPTWTTTYALNFLNSFIPQIRALGVKVKLTIQGYANPGTTATVNSYINSLLALSNIDEFIHLSTTYTEIDAGTYVSLNNPFPDQPITTFNSFILVNDTLTEGTERITLRLTGPGRTESAFADILDTSRTAAAQTFVLSKNIAGTSINEGQSVVFTLTTTNVPNGTLVPFTITPGASNFTLDDFDEPTKSTLLANGGLFGSFVVNNNTATFTVAIRADLLSEGPQSFDFTLANTPSETFTILVNDTSTSVTSFALARSVASVNEGQSFIVYLTTSGPPLADGTLVPYTVTGISAGDLATGSAPLSGNFAIVSSGEASLQFDIASDLTTETTETFTLTLSGPGRSESINVTVNDTSLTPTSTFALSRSASSVNEGGTVAIILSTTGVGTGTSVPYTVSGVSSADISGASLTGNFTTNAAGGASVVFTLAADAQTEGTETLTLSLNGRSENISVTINDTSVVTYEIFTVPTTQAVNEDRTIAFYLRTAGLPDGSIVPFNIVGINTDDIDTTSNLGALTGTFVNNPTLTTPNVSGPVYLTFRNDIKSEGNEVGTIALDNGLATNTFIILDTSTSPPLTPGYSLKANVSSANEGNSIAFILSTVNVAESTVLPYTITGVSSADVVGGSLTGTFTVNAEGNASTVVSLVQDNLTEGIERLRLTVDSTTEFADVLILDTSKSPPIVSVAYTLTSNTSSVREGADVVVNLATTNLGAGTFVPYVLSGVTSSDVNVPLAGGSFRLNTIGQASVVISALADLTTEGVETLKLSIADNLLANISITILDTSVGRPTFTLSSNVSGPIGEGNSIVFIVTTTNIPTGTAVPWKITGINVTSSDLGGSALAGNFVTNANGGASVEIPITADVLPEGTETLRFALDQRTEFLLVSILDTSKPPQTFTLRPSSTVITEGSSLLINLSSTGTIAGLSIPYVISGTISSDDYTYADPANAGRFILDANGNSSVRVTFVTDFITEGNETFTLRLTESGDSITVTVADFSYQSLVPANFVEAVPGAATITNINEPVSPYPSTTISIPTLEAITNKPSSFIENLIPEINRSGGGKG